MPPTSGPGLPYYLGPPCESKIQGNLGGQLPVTNEVGYTWGKTPGAVYCGTSSTWGSAVQSWKWALVVLADVWRCLLGGGSYTWCLRLN
ncbi:hypothetical protein NDU88_011272 [Pleurodeles waltl]|uniref:Uncharacterized protein n=1 Tax=Pleurodeles waltl TaxID=8319 RepID=A0AAV7R2W7_PLEWA|nr:hypothetical protein NDU88_011272 [Pleurodeles waltl]